MAVIYIIFIIAILVGTNARHLLITPIIIIVGCLIVKYFQSNTMPSFLRLKNVVLSIVAFLFISGPFSDLATAMVLVRSVRGDVAFNELISETLNVYKDKDALQAARDMSMENDNSNNLIASEWDENYTSNVFLQRFCNYRVVDASIFHALRVGFLNSKMIEISLDQLKVLPPSPIPEVLFHIDKDKHFAPMDYLFSLSTHTAPHAMLRVGGDVGLGLSVFGYFYFPLQFCVYYLLFILLNSLSLLTTRGRILSVLALIQLMDLFNLMTVHSGLMRHIIFLIWGFWYNAILLGIIVKLTGFFVARTNQK